MLIIRRSSPKVAGALAVALILFVGLASAVQAKQFAMSGKWVQRRGVVYIPVGPQSGGIPAISGAVATSVTGPPPQALMVPKHQFYVRTSVKSPIPQPSVVQLSSHFTENGPLTTGVFQAGHWVATRPFPNFAWCPGAAANPACTTPKSTGQTAPPGQGTNHGRIRYKAGTAQYGGTMQMLSGGGGVISLLLGATGPTVMHNPFGGATGAAPTEAPGGPYANSTLDDVLPGGPITTGCQFSPYGLITVPGTPTGGYGTTATWNQWGFPWTTGTIYISVSYAGGYTPTIVTVAGSDARTPGGAGNITLVAGGIANGLHSGLTYMSFDYVTMTLTSSPTPLPSTSPAGIAAGAVLVVLAVGYALRRRL